MVYTAYYNLKVGVRIPFSFSADNEQEAREKAEKLKDQALKLYRAKHIGTIEEASLSEVEPD